MAIYPSELEHIKKFHREENKINVEKVIATFQNIPLEKPMQLLFLGHMRTLFFTKEYDNYCSISRKAMMSEREIIARKEFYLSFARMISRHALIQPGIAENTYFKYIAEDMVDGGDDELGEAGKMLQYVLKKPSSKTPTDGKRVQCSPIPEFTEEYWDDFGMKPLRFIENHIEWKWQMNKTLSLHMAVAAELLELDVKMVIDYLSGKSFSYILFFKSLQQTVIKELMHSGHYEWAELVQKALHIIANEKIINTVENNAERKPNPEGLPSFPPELKLEYVSKLFYDDKETSKAISLGVQRFSKTPDDAYCCGLLASMYLDVMELEKALYLIARTYHLMPDNILTIFTLARIFNEGYFTKQTDTCLEKLKSLSEYNHSSSEYKLPVQLLIKSTKDGTIGLLNGTAIGKCPLQFKTNSGKHRIGWELNGELLHEIEVDLQECTVSKFKFNLADGLVEDEISRDGAITVFKEDCAVQLEVIVKDFLVDDLEDLPNPSFDEIWDVIEE